MAVSVGQPYGVYYPLLLIGGLAIVIFGSILMFRIVRERRSAEIRQMHAMDL